MIQSSFNAEVDGTVTEVVVEEVMDGTEIAAVDGMETAVVDGTEIKVVEDGTVVVDTTATVVKVASSLRLTSP